MARDLASRAQQQFEIPDVPSRRLCRAMRTPRGDARRTHKRNRLLRHHRQIQRIYMRMRHTRMPKTMSVRVVQISRRNASSSRPQNHGLHFAVQHPSHQRSIVGRDLNEKNSYRLKPDNNRLADHHGQTHDGGANGGRPLAQGDHATGSSAQPSAQGEQAQGVQAQLRPASTKIGG